ncbi:cytosolic phospholipase A2 delta-like [Varanus komodoensis]|uniref:cytosolic phospholipase A2 delta-like n=1 Tax=Varanus komodoensis TaxID=61221 RepID=UPI001CF798AB|nr:cytosolic phospholipase A2 delta-like [Varanus komodoensis]
MSCGAGNSVQPCDFMSCHVFAWQIQACPTSLLTVKILQARNITVGDLLSGADCYVSLRLPTASKEEVKTETIKNSSVPVWNETFYFMIQRQVKNILELRIYDEDPLTKDDLLFTVLFDVGEVKPGETFLVNFILNSEVQHLPHIFVSYYSERGL